MSSAIVKQENAVESVEGVVDFLVDSELPVKSVTVICDVIAGAILGEVDEVDHEMELAAGVSYVVIGLGKLATDYERGINFVEVRRGKKG